MTKNEVSASASTAGLGNLNGPEQGATTIRRNKSARAREEHGSPSSDPFSELNDLLSRWFYEPDLQAIRIVLGAIQAHYLDCGDPVWLFVVAPPGCGKTTMSIAGAGNLSEVLLIGDLTPNTFLSGFYGQKEPGLLEKLGKSEKQDKLQTTTGNAVFLVKDFTTVLSMNREKRAAILSQLREVFDGEFKRDFGTGESKIWRGKITVVAAVTPALDQKYSIFSALGERFLQVRWHRPNSEKAGERAIEQQGKESKIREQARDAVSELFRNATKEPPDLSSEMRKRIASLAEVIALARTHVYRSGYGDREIELVPEAEANTRIAKSLAALARGIASLHGRSEVAEQDLQDTMRVGFDCLKAARREVLVAVIEGRDTKSVALHRTLRERELEELEALGVVETSEGLTTKWALTKKIQDLLSVAKVESADPRSVPKCQG